MGRESIGASYIDGSFEEFYCKGRQRNGSVADWRSRIRKSFIISPLILLLSLPLFFLLMVETIIFYIGGDFLVDSYVDPCI